MIKITNLQSQNVLELSDFEIDKLIPRANYDLSDAQKDVEPLLKNIVDYGDEALYDQSEKFDNVILNPKKGGKGYHIPQSLLKESWDNLDQNLKRAFDEAIDRITKVHKSQIPKEFKTVLDTADDGEAAVYQRWIPVSKVGLYVPGGQAVYPSSVLMNAIPALAAGVKELIIASPPQKEFGGYPHRTILAAAYRLGVDNVVALGGVSAIGYFAYLAKADLITGPGNIYVAAAKSLVSSGIYGAKVGIDSVAGPSEIGIIADQNANPKFLAADLIGQAEHDELAGAVLFTNDSQIADKTVECLKIQVSQAKHTNRISASLKGSQSGIFVTNTIEECIKLANAYGAEHLEIHCKNAQNISKNINNAGAIFIGDYTPVPLGDYLGGSNHVLPTSGLSKFSSGLNTLTFLKSVQQIEYTKQTLSKVTEYVDILSIDEDLPAHGQALKVRYS